MPTQEKPKQGFIGEARTMFYKLIVLAKFYACQVTNLIKYRIDYNISDQFLKKCLVYMCMLTVLLLPLKLLLF